MPNAKVTLAICDGLGLSPEVYGNAILQAPTPTLDYIFSNYPSLRLLAAGGEVGLDMGETGNSEVGHLTVGTGQVLPQAYQLINGSIKSEEYKKNKVFLDSFTQVRKNNSTLHIVGLISRGGVHGHLDHMLALLDLAKEKGVDRVAIHAITDGRDSDQRVALADSQALVAKLQLFSFGVIATIGGRFYAMDRDKNWERTDVYYWAMLGRANTYRPTFDLVIQEGYARGESDENLQPAVISGSGGRPVAPLADNDAVIFTNYRPDRIRQLATRVIMGPQALTVATMTDYFLGAVPPVANPKTKIMDVYPLPKPRGTLAETLARSHKSQLHMAETEKYAHVTYFFNGHQEKRKPREDWLLIPSVKVDFFDRTPAMSAELITDAYMNAKIHQGYDFVVLNYANMDMIGHTGNFEATKLAVTFVDAQLKLLLDYTEHANEWLIVTGDHGNAEQMLNPATGEIDKEHTTNPVPFILVHPSLKSARGMDKTHLALMSHIGMLADVAPTVLEIMELSKPTEMVGESLLPYLVKS